MRRKEIDFGAEVFEVRGGAMPIEKSTVEAGWLYKTSNNQERVVLGCNSECKVVYASRGGNVQNAFDHREASTLEHFAEACSEKVRSLTADELQKVVASCNASSVIVSGETCCFVKS